MKLHTLLTLFLLLFTGFALGATPTPVLRGKIIDRQSKSPVSYATVTLALDHKAVKAEAADASGRFEIAAPAAKGYTLAITMIGYKTFTREIDLETSTDLGTLELDAGVTVEEVIIEVFKPVVKVDAEKMTYSVENDPQASGSTIDEIIRKVPQLSIDGEGNVLLNGKGDYKILLNGHVSTSYNNNFKEIIKSMPADQISRIEVITNPSVKYDAEGTSGVINLVTVKKKHEFGYNGSLYAGIITSSDDPAGYNAGANFSLQKGKFAMNLQGWYYDAPMHSTILSRQENFDSENRYNDSRAQSDNKFRNGTINLDMSYQPDTLNLLTLNLSYGGYKSTGHATSDFQLKNPSLEELFRYTEHRHNLYSAPTASLTTNYEHTFGRAGHVLTFSDEVAHEKFNADSDNEYQGGYTHRKITDNGSTSLSNTFQIDYANPLSEHHSVEAGIKHIYRHNTTPMTSLVRPDPDTDYAPGPYSDMDYRQHILALYAGYGITCAKWSARVGTRMERTWNDAEAEDQDHARYSFRNRQFNIVPFVSISFLPRPTHSLSLSYTQRLQRPSVQMLSPAVESTTPLYISYGNPDLEAAVSHSFALNYGYYSRKWNLMAGVTSSFSNNLMSMYSTADDKGVVTSTYSNDVHTRSVGFFSSLTMNPSRKFNLTLTFGGDYSKYDFDRMNIHSDHFNFNQNLNMNIALWKDAWFTAGEFYYSGYNFLGAHTGDYFSYYFSLKQEFLKKRLELSITANDLFSPTLKYTYTVENPTYRLNQTSRQALRRVRFTLRWRFGHKSVRVKTTRHTIKNDDIMESKQQGGTVVQ